MCLDKRMGWIKVNWINLLKQSSLIFNDPYQFRIVFNKFGKLIIMIPPLNQEIFFCLKFFQAPRSGYPFFIGIIVYSDVYFIKGFNKFRVLSMTPGYILSGLVF